MIPRHLWIGVAITLAAALGMGFYVWQMRGRVQSQLPVTDIRPVAPPPSGPTEQATLFVAYDDPGVLLPQTASIPLPQGRQQRAEELLRALLDVYVQKSSPHPVPSGAEVHDVFFVDPGLVVVDLNAAFANGHRSGILTEELTIASLIQTLTHNIPGIIRVKFLVDGRERDTLAGHVDLTGFYDVSQIGEMVRQLQSTQ
jgi:Sporulation and spore germination